MTGRAESVIRFHVQRRERGGLTRSEQHWGSHPGAPQRSEGAAPDFWDLIEPLHQIHSRLKC
jgi:hypothetical protein